MGQIKVHFYRKKKNGSTGALNPTRVEVVSTETQYAPAELCSKQL